MSLDDWQNRMCQDYVTMQARMQRQIKALRAERDALQRRIDSMPSTLTELQDRVTMLESRT